MTKFKSKSSEIISMPVILIGAGILTAIICGVLFYPKDDSSAERQALVERIAFLEERLRALESQSNDYISRFDSMDETLRSFTEQSERLQALPIEIESIQKKIEYLDKRQGNLEKKAVSFSRKKTATSRTVKSAKVTKKKAVSQPKASPSSGYHQIRDGETLFSIANRYGLSLDQLLKLNNISADAVIQPGQKLIIRR